MRGKCKSCAHLCEWTSGDDYFYRCNWRTSIEVPWAETFRLADLSNPVNRPFIGKRHVEGDWSEAMDCPAWQAAP